MLLSHKAKPYQQECAVSFDPSEYSVKEAVSRLDDLSLDDLSAVLSLELENKHRSSLVSEIGRAIDAAKTADEAEEAVEEPVEVEAVVAARPKQLISLQRLLKLRPDARKKFTRRQDGMFEA